LGHPLLNPKAKERVGYPTQKPILLLERIIGLVTSPGDLVLDPFTGSGTTLVAAELLGRKSLGIDIATEAVQLATLRLEQPFKTSSELFRKGREAYVQSDEEALAYLHGLPIVPVQRNRGIDGDSQDCTRRESRPYSSPAMRRKLGRRCRVASQRRPEQTARDFGFSRYRSTAARRIIQSATNGCRAG